MDNYEIRIYQDREKGYERRIKDLQQQLEEKDKYIQEMVAKAAAKHRPAYDEQQQKILGLTIELDEKSREVETVKANRDYFKNRRNDERRIAEKLKAENGKLKRQLYIAENGLPDGY